MSTLLIAEVEKETAPAQIVLQMLPVLNLTEDQFFEFCQINGDLRIERNAQQEIIVMSPTGGLSGKRELKIVTQLEAWSQKNGTGTAFSPSTGYRLPNGAMRAPDGSWVSNIRLNKLTLDDQEKFLPLCPEFVAEVKSPTDRMVDVLAKMDEYIANGTKLGILILPKMKQVRIYRPNQPVQQIDQAEKINCSPEMPGFDLDLREIL